MQWMKEHSPLHFIVVAIEKGAFGSPSTKFANFTYLLVLLDILSGLGLCVVL